MRSHFADRSSAPRHLHPPFISTYQTLRFSAKVCHNRRKPACACRRRYSTPDAYGTGVRILAADQRPKVTVSQPLFCPIRHLTYPVIALLSFRASSETDSAPVSTIVSSPPTSKPSATSPVPGSAPSQQPSAPTIHSYLLPHSQGVHQPSSSGKPYVPSKSIQKLTQYPSGGGPGSTGVNGTSGGPTNQIGSPVMDKLLDDDADGANERWSDRFSFVAKDSYGNLRYVFPPSVLSV